MKTKEKYLNDIIQHGIDNLANISEGQEAADLHNELYNMDYFIIGTFQAKEWLTNGPGVFEAIDEIKEYEEGNFGSMTTEISPEKIANMYAYIKGEEILGDCATLQKKWNEKLTKADIKKIKKELEKQLS